MAIMTSEIGDSDITKLPKWVQEVLEIIKNHAKDVLNIDFVSYNEHNFYATVWGNKHRLYYILKVTINNTGANAKNTGDKRYVTGSINRAPHPQFSQIRYEAFYNLFIDEPNKPDEWSKLIYTVHYKND